MLRTTAALALLALPLQLAAHDVPRTPLHGAVADALAKAGPGVRWGIVVADASGREVVTIDPQGRYIPASNTKLYTTAAAFWKLSALDKPDGAGTQVWLEPAKKGAPNVVLDGRGDARMSGAADCARDCLSALADAVAAKTRRVGDVIGSDTAFADQRWGPGMSWNNIPTRSGTGVSALSLDDNEVALTVTPGAAGAAANVTGNGYFTIVGAVTTGAPGSKAVVGFDRMPGSRTLRIAGSVAADSSATPVRVGVDDPADYAAWTLARMLAARGVKVEGQVKVRHRPAPVLDDDDLPLAGTAPAPAAAPVGAPATPPPSPIAVLEPPPLGETISVINKRSQNLYAELLNRRLGLLAGQGTIGDGLAVVDQMLTAAGLPKQEWSLSDGSGMSSYNRVAPRGTVRLLRWTQAQPWGAAFRATLPVGGVDGTLTGRFKGTPLEGKVMAKTGSLNATNALAGFLTAKSGKVYTFAIYANDVPAGVAATRAMDEALVLVAAAL